jgi:iron complex transport system permease protein
MARSSASGFLIALAVLLAALLLAFTVGRYPAGVGDMFDLVVAKLTGHTSGVPPAAADVLLHVRGPRVLAAVLVGAALAVAGTAFQGLFRNLPHGLNHTHWRCFT